MNVGLNNKIDNQKVYTKSMKLKQAQNALQVPDALEHTYCSR